MDEIDYDVHNRLSAFGYRVAWSKAVVEPQGAAPLGDDPVTPVPVRDANPPTS